MRLSTVACIMSLILVPSTSRAFCQENLWEAKWVRLKYEGVVQFPEGERHVTLDLSRKPLMVRSGGREVMRGWHLDGGCEVSDGKYYSVHGASRILDDSSARESEVVLKVEEYLDSLVGTFEGELGSEYFEAIWRPGMNSSAAILCTLRLESIEEVDDPWNNGYFESDFILFWKRLQEMVRKRDRRAVARMIRFPLQSMDCMVGEWYASEDHDGRLSRRRFLKEFDKIFDETVTGEIVQHDALEIQCRVYDHTSEYFESDVELLRMPQGTILYTLSFNPYSEFTRIYTFAKVNGVYRLIDVNCAG